MGDAPEPPRRHPSSASAMRSDRHTPERAPSRGTAPPASVMGDDRTPERMPSRGATPSVTGDDRRTPQRTLSRGAPAPPVFAEEDAERPPSEMIPHIPPPAPPAAGDANFEDALRERRERLDDAERELAQILQYAHDAENRHENEFREHEDARDQIFGDNEERREQESKQRIQELEDRIAGIPQVQPVPVPPPVDPEQMSMIDSIRAATSDAASRHSSDIMETVRMEREEAASERASLAAERDQERARLDEARRQIDEDHATRTAALEDELARTRTELAEVKQMRMTEQNEAQMAAIERDEALRNQLADLTTMIQQNQTLCEEKRALMEEHWAEKQRWKEERDGQMQELMGMVSRLVDEQAAARQREEEQRQANEGKPGELNDCFRSLLGSSWRLQASSKSWRNCIDRTVNKENFSMLYPIVSSSGFS